MARISQLPLLAVPTGAEMVPVVVGGQTRRVPVGPLVTAAAGPAIAEATVAANASADAATRAQAIVDAQLDLAAADHVFDTKAQATAAAAAIADGAVVQVLVDESRARCWTIYRKDGSALRFVRNRADRVSVTPEQFGAVGDCNPRTGAGTDDTSAIEAALDYLYAHGGGRIELGARWYRLTRCLRLRNTSTAQAIGTQPAVVIVGQGCSSQGGKGDRWIAASGLFWSAEGGDAVAKIDTRGIGTLTLADFDLGSAGLARPFLHTTFTTLFAMRVGFVSPRTGLDCTDDAIVCGGTRDFEVDPAFDRRSADCGFQGYGTVIEGCYFNGVRRVLVTQRHANAIRFVYNNIWGACGNARAIGAAIESDGAPVDALTYATGVTVFGNLFELGAYKRAIYLVRSYAWHIGANDVYDADDHLTVEGVYVDPSCVAIRVDGSLRPAATLAGVDRPYLTDPGKVCISVPIYRDEWTRFGRIDAGDDQFPNRFGSTRFDAPGAAPVLYQSRQAEVPGAAARMMVRVSFNPLAPSGEDVIDIVLHGGGRQIGGGEAGNVYNWAAAAASRGASFWNSGRSWGFDRTDPVAARREGASMGVDTGTGGNFLDLWAIQHRIRDHTGKLGATFYPAAGTLDLASGYMVDGKVVVGARQPAIASDKTTAEKIELILRTLRNHGLIDA